MTSYKRFIPPTLPTGDAAAGSLFADISLARLCAREPQRQKAELENWETEGGSVAASLDVARELSALARADRSMRLLGDTVSGS